MRHLFGSFCSGTSFRHDVEMMKLYAARLEQESYERRGQMESQNETQSSGVGTASPHANTHVNVGTDGEGEGSRSDQNDVESDNHLTAPAGVVILREETSPTSETIAPPPAQDLQRSASPTDQARDEQEISLIDDTELPSALKDTSFSDAKRPASRTSHASKEHKHKRPKNWQIAYDAALGINGLTWADYGGIVSARPQVEEEEL